MVFPRRSHIALLERNQTERIGRKLFEFVLGMSVLQEFQSLHQVAACKYKGFLMSDASVWCWWHFAFSGTQCSGQLLKKYSLKTAFLSEVLSFFQTGKRDYHCCFLVEGGLAKQHTFHLTFFLNLTQVPPFCISPFQAGEKKECPYTNISFLCT